MLNKFICEFLSLFYFILMGRTFGPYLVIHRGYSQLCSGVTLVVVRRPVCGAGNLTRASHMQGKLSSAISNNPWAISLALPSPSWNSPYNGTIWYTCFWKLNYMYEYIVMGNLSKVIILHMLLCTWLFYFRFWRFHFIQFIWICKNSLNYNKEGWIACRHEFNPAISYCPPCTTTSNS